jgi:SAM-dependent methyltransferase
MNETILDPASGGRMFWFNKRDTRVLFGDVRDESWELCDGRRFEVRPDRVMDYRDLPFPDGSFRLVVLDPPHLDNASPTAYMAKKYGRLTEHWHSDFKSMFSECFRVLEPNGILIFKWNETRIHLSEVLSLTDERPLFGNRQPKQTGTHWVVWMKEQS